MTHPQTADLVRTHFHKTAAEFDSIYTGEVSPVMRFLNKTLRRDIYQRYEETIKECGDVNGKHILDIGCGSGRYCHELASRGAGKCVGIDFAPNMLELARSVAAQRQVANRCQWVLAQYLDFKVEKPFDISIAMGYFDYIEDALGHLKKMRQDTTEKVIAIWPVAGTARAAIRKVRLGLKGCPVFYFTPEQVRDLHAQAGLKVTRLDRLGQLWFTVGVPEESSR